MAYTYLFFVILLVRLLGLEGAQGPCPTPCHCSLEILNCSRISNPPGFHQVPLPKMAAHPHPFTYLDFTGNAISSIGKEVWDAYPWAEYLVLKDNSLRRLQNSSLEGLLSLTYLDVSCNKIQIIERNVFEAVPFLQILNLRGNIIEEIAEGTFQAWHGLQFLLKVDLSHNPLAVIQDPYFYRLPSLKLLDLGATEVTPRILEDLLQTSLQLKTLLLPEKMSCCLCNIKEDIEVFHETVKLECTESCDINATLCEKEEPLNTMQEVVLKILEIRKWNGSGLLSILPERTISNNDKPERAEPHDESLALAENYSSLAANLNLLKSVKRLMQMKADESLDINWADKRELEKLYLLTSLLQVALKEKIFELDKVSPEATVQNEPSDHVLKKPAKEARKGSADTSLKKKRHVRKVKRDKPLGRNQRPKDTLFRLGRDGQQVAKTATQSGDKPSVFESHHEVESWRKLPEGLETQRALPFLNSHQRALQSSWKRSISDSPTDVLNPTVSTIVDNDLPSLSSEGNSVLVLKKILGSQILTKEELLNPLLHSNDLAGDGKTEISADDSKTSLNELSPDVTLPYSPSWEPQSTSVSPLMGSLAHEDGNLIQGELFETEVNKKLTSLIPNTPLRNLISHMVRILKMDCAAPSLQRACAKLLYRTSLLGKLPSGNDKETSSLWNSYFWLPMNVADMPTASSNTMEQLSGKIASQVVPIHKNGNKQLLAISVTAIIVIIIAAISLIAIWSQFCATKDRASLGRRERSLTDEELSSTSSPLMDGKPLWLKDMYYIQDEMQRNNIVENLHDEESLEEMDMGQLGQQTPPVTPPPPPPTPSQKAIEKKSSESSSKNEGQDEGENYEGVNKVEDGDKESSAEKSENPSATEATSEAPEEAASEAPEEAASEAPEEAESEAPEEAASEAPETSSEAPESGNEEDEDEE